MYTFINITNNNSVQFIFVQTYTKRVQVETKNTLIQTIQKQGNNNNINNNNNVAYLRRLLLSNGSENKSQQRNFFL
jgi:hypothetical protein